MSPASLVDPEKRKALLEAMAASIKPPEGELPADFSAMKKINVEGEPPPPRVNIGSTGSLTGLTLPKGDAASPGMALGGSFKQRLMQQRPNAEADPVPQDVLQRGSGPVVAVPSFQDRLLGNRMQQDARAPQQPDTSTRPRQVSPSTGPQIQIPPTDPSRPAAAAGSFQQRLMQNRANDAFGSSGEPFNATRERRVEPRDYVADDSQYLRDLRSQPLTKRDKLGMVLDAISQSFGNKHQPSRREREIGSAESQLAADLATQQGQARIGADVALANERANKPAAGSTRIVADGEYDGVPGGTEIRQTWDPRQRQMVDVLRGQNPVISKPAPQRRVAPSQIEYENGNAMLVTKDPSGPSVQPILKKDGTPLTKTEHDSGNVQTAFRLAPDGITQIQIERDRKTGQWIDSVGAGGKPVVRGQVGKIDPTTGAPVASVMAGNRVTSRDDAENARKRQAYESEVSEWGQKEQTYRANKQAEDQALKTKQDRLSQLLAEKRSWTPALLGGRSSDDIQAEIDRTSAEIKTHRANSQKFQKDADDAAEEATKARRNAGLYSQSTAPATRTRSAKPGRIQPNEDPNVRDYANQFFKGDYAAAQRAIAAQRQRK